MPPRKTPRLAYCEYVIPDLKSNTAVWMARLDLMEAVQHVYPTMLQRLSLEVFPKYKAAAESGFNFDAILWNQGSPFTQLGDPALRDALETWARAFNADVPWFLDDTLRTLRGWHVVPDWRDSLKWHDIGGVSSTLAIGERFQFDCEGWEMQLLTWAAYSKSVRERFEQKLAEYEAASRRLAESRGLERVQKKYSPSNLEWFVLYQFAGWSSRKIAVRVANEDPNAEIQESTVLKGVKAAAKLVGWGSLRPVPRYSNRKIR